MKKFIIIVTVVIIALIVAGVYYFSEKSPVPGLNQPTPSPTPVVSAVPTQVITTDGMKLYKNTEFGFEFKYQDDLIIRENSFGNYYSKFNIEVVAKQGEYLDSVIMVNVVLPEFTERTFLGSGATTSTVTVDGRIGIKYEYEFEGLPESAIVLSLGEYKIILGRLGSIYQNEYDGYFNQIIDSFKFLK